MQPADANSSARHFVSTLVEITDKGLRVYAYCPICDRAEQSDQDRRGEQRATAISIAKIRAHMKTRHRVAAF